MKLKPNHDTASLNWRCAFLAWGNDFRMTDRSADDERQRTDRVTAVLSHIDQTGEVPLRLRTDASLFLSRLHAAWVENGGLRSGKTRNSVRRIKELLGENQKIRSLQPKLDGKTRISRSDADALLALYLSHWTYASGGHGNGGASGDGYDPFPAKDPDELRKSLLDAIFPSESQAAKRGVLIERNIQKDGSDASLDDDFRLTGTIINDAISKSSAFITFSRERTVIARTPGSSIWSMTSRFSEVFANSGSTNACQLIWIVDLGSRNINHKDSFNAYYNVEFLRMIFRALNVFNIHNSKSLLSWLHSRAVVVVGSLHQFEIDRLYENAGLYLDNVEPNLPWVTAQHILPREIPTQWMQHSSLRRLYGENLETLDSISFSVAIGKTNPSSPNEELHRQGKVEYFAHGYPPNSSDTEPLRGVQLPSPDEAYDQAFQLIHRAASCRLSQNGHDPDRASPSATKAIVHLRRLGFAVVKLSEFLELDSLIRRHEM